MARARLPKMKAHDEWHQNDRGCWSLSLGERGYRVRVTQRARGGVFGRVSWIPGRGESRASLHTASRPEARQQAEMFLRALQASDAPVPRSPLTLGELLTRYEEGPTYKANTKRTQVEHAARVKLLLVFFGARFPVDRLSLADIARYAAVRKRGTGWPDGRTTATVRARSVAYDFQVLRAAIRWACTVREPDGAWLLQENPLRGLKLPREANPRRPVATHDRFVAVLEAAQQLAGASTTERDRARWIRLELALVLAEATGRRIGAIAGLKWADVATNPAAITWRAVFDKRRREQTIPIPAPLAAELRGFRAKLGAFDEGGSSGDRRRLRRGIERRSTSSCEGPRNRPSSHRSKEDCGTRIAARGRRPESICRRSTS
ncbi:MAG: hypothetical protein M3081_03550 [Gemmatimonadota bacterium]|nr:hypothetical protein [Gemmatimonadota bacterium]